jgi:hypothetical protein
LGRGSFITYYHAAEAQALGYDIETEEGNLQFALWLNQKEGATPWQSSRYCWSKT